MAGNKMNYGCKNIGCNSELAGKGLTEIGGKPCTLKRARIIHRGKKGEGGKWERFAYK